MNQETLLQSVRNRFAGIVPYSLIQQQIAEIWKIFQESGMGGIKAAWQKSLVAVLLIVAYIAEKTEADDPRDDEPLLFGNAQEMLSSDEEARYRLHCMAVGCNEEPMPSNVFAAGPIGGIKDVVIQAFVQRMLDALWQYIQTMDVQEILDMLGEKIKELMEGQ
jgi:hypothetical protein